MTKNPARQLHDFTRSALALGRTTGERSRIFWRLTKNLRVRLGLARYHPDQVFELPTRYRVLFLRDNFGDVTNLPDLFYRSVYRVRGLAEEGAVLDIGANVGLFAAWIDSHNPGRQIHCFEPLATNAALIPLNCPTATLHRVALGSVRATIQLRVDAHSLMASSIPTAWPTSVEEFEVVALDEVTAQHGIGQVALMKIDTEGMELEVLDGAWETLLRTQRVAMETHGVERHQRSKARLAAAGLHIDHEEFSGGTGLVFASRS